MMNFDPDVDELTALKNENRRLQAVVANIRIGRWHATYNAALTGLHANGRRETTETLHFTAAMAADRAHGEL